MGTNEQPKRRFFYGWVIMLMCMMLCMCGNGFVNIFNTFNPVFRSTYDWTATSLSMIPTAVAVGNLVGNVVLMNMFKKKSSRFCIIVFGGIVSAGLICTAFITNIYVLTAVFFICGCAMPAVAQITIPILIQKWFDARRNIAQGIAFVGSTFANIILAPVFTYFLYTYNLRVGLILWGGIFAAAILLNLLLTKDKPEDMGLKPYGHNPGDPPPSKANKSESGVLIGFTSSEMIKMKEFYFACAAILLTTICCQGVIINVSSNLILNGYTPVVAAGIMSAYSTGVSIGKVCFGYLVDRFGAFKTLTSSHICLLLAYLMFYFVGQSITFAWLFVIFASLGYCWGSLAPLTICSGMFGDKYFADNIPKITIAFYIGPIIGAPVAGIILDLTGAFQVALLLFVVLVALAEVLLQFGYRSAANKLKNRAAAHVIE